MSSRRAAMAVVVGMVLLASSVFPAWTSAPRVAEVSSRQADGDTQRISQDFSRPGSRSSMRLLGPGRWKVAGGRLVLDGARRGTGTVRVPVALHERTVRGDQWELRATVRPLGRGADASVLLGWSGPRDHVEVHLDRVRSRSGVYALLDGRRTRVATLPLAATTGVAHAVTAAYRDGVLTVGVRRAGARRTTSVPVMLPGSTRVGFGSRGGSASFDRLRVTEQRRGRAVSVTSSDELTRALAGAQPGDVITLADGIYTSDGLEADLSIGGKSYYGTFVVAASGTAASPIVIQGSRGAVIDAAPGEDGTGSRYGLYLAGVQHVEVRGLTVRNAAKGIVADRSSYAVLSGVLVEDVGQEGIHLRADTHHSVVADSVVRRTGLDNPSFGEGIYVGSAHSNWDTYSDGAPDRSDHNQILRNTISETGAESVDIKEGTSHGLVADNVFDGSGMTGSYADSWVDVKGISWRIVGNRGTTALEDGFQVHGALDGWGLDNVFVGNVADVRGPGYGFWVQDNVTGTRVSCDNVVSAAASGFTNAGACRPGP